MRLLPCVVHNCRSKGGDEFMTTVTGKLAEYLDKLQFEDLPEKVTAQTKYCLLDALGCGLGAVEHPDIKKMAEALLNYDNASYSSVWGMNKKTSLGTAVFINSSMVHTFDFDDAHKMGKVHAGAVIIPVALALAEIIPITGKQLITAIVGAYEVMLRIAIGIGSSSHRLKGWHNTGTCGTFGAAAVAGKLLGLTPQQFIYAFGNAGTQSSGLWAFSADGSSSKKLHAGKAAQSGLTSALLAKKDFTGPSQIIEAEDGGLFRAVSDEYNYERVTKDLGSTFQITDVSYKPYPCCRTIHPSIDAALQVREQGLNPDDIEEIKVYTYKVAKVQNDLPLPPQNGMIAQFNLPFIVAAALFEGPIGMQHFEERYYRDEEILALAEKVKVLLDEEIEKDYPAKWKCRMEVTAKDGRQYFGYTDAAKGDPMNPLSKEQHYAKFHNLLKNTRIDVPKLLKVVENLEEMENVRELIEIII